MRRFCLIFVCLAFVATLHSEGYFGKNRLLKRPYPYKVWETDHFLIHYYETNPLLIEECATYLEAAFSDITARLDAKPDKKIPFFVYTNHNEFEQTRIVDIGEGTGGVTESFKDRLLVFNSGSQSWLRHVIFHEFTHSTEFAILNSGFWKSARLIKSILYPLWIMEGMAEYMAGNIDETTDTMYARDSATSKRSPPFDLKDLHNFNHLKPNQVTKAYKQGALVLKFIAEEYGEEKLSEILKSFWARYDINTVLIDVLGIDLDRLDKNFREWLEENYAETSVGLDEASRYGARLTASEPPIPVFRWSPVSSPGGEKIYYIALREGFPAIYELNTKTHKQKIVVGKSYGKIDWIALENRNLSISLDGRYLYFIGEKNEDDYLYRYDLQKRKLVRRAVAGLNVLKSPSPNPVNANEVALSAMENGFNDIYIVDFDKGAAELRVTEDPRDDDEPIFTKDGSAIIYSSEMPVSAAGYPNRDLFVWHRDTKVAALILRSPAVEKEAALSLDGNHVFFVSDLNGAWNLYDVDLSSSQVFRKTNVVGGVFSPSQVNEKDVLFANFRDGEVDAYLGTREKFLNENVTALFSLGELSKLKPQEVIAKEKESQLVPALRYRGPYKTSFGTDLFFPAFFFLTQGGLFALSYWQGSDLLGYHSVANQILINSGSNLLDYSLLYAYARYRPTLELILKGAHYPDFSEINDQGGVLRKKEHLQAGLVSYPLDRFNRLESGLVFVERNYSFPDSSESLSSPQDLHVLGQYVRDTTTAPYLVVTRGSRLMVGTRKGSRAGNFDLSYLTKYLEWHQYFPIAKDSAIASRLAINSSNGLDPEKFPLGGRGGVRGYAAEFEPSRFHNTLVHNFEIRVPLVPDLNYHMWYMFPDFYIKNIYLGVFSDQGIRWNENTKDLVRNKRLENRRDFFHAAGLNLKFNTFILETFPFFFSLEWAKRTTERGHVFYGSVFQFFTFR